ncbi:hypothetical protein ACOME3_007648 [Neoechinorhynchus agilis]
MCCLNLSDRIFRPIVYGNTAQFLIKDHERRELLVEDNENQYTHRWKLFLRSDTPNEDLSVYVDRVVFHLHKSYSNPTRVCRTSPYEVQEYGWGSFQVEISVYFRGTEKLAVHFKHFLQLYANSSGVDVMDEHSQYVIHDFFVFSKPSLMMRNLLNEAIKPSDDRLPKLIETEKDESEVVRNSSDMFIDIARSVEKSTNDKIEESDTLIDWYMEKIREAANVYRGLRRGKSKGCGSDQVTESSSDETIVDESFE